MPKQRKIEQTILVVLLWLRVTAAFLPFNRVHSASSTAMDGLSMSVSSTAADGSASAIVSTMKKMSRVLTVGLEYSGKELSPTELSIISMQLRKCKVSAIYTQDVEAIKEFSAEQQSAMGNFPGPCPVIFHGSVEKAQDALEAGASAVVLPVEAVDNVESFAGEIIWKVETAQDIDIVLEKTSGNANVFLIDGNNGAISSLAESIPSKSLWVAAVDAMLEDGAEVALGKQLQSQGCGSILVRNAVVGDSEDMEYAQFCVGGLTSKASSEFKFSGLTGSTNGHFGGVQSNSSIKWRRVSR